jgi:hypothetical protein
MVFKFCINDAALPTCQQEFRKSNKKQLDSDKKLAPVHSKIRMEGAKETVLREQLARGFSRSIEGNRLRSSLFLPMVACLFPVISVAQTIVATSGSGQEGTTSQIADSIAATVTIAAHYDTAVGTSDAASQGVILGELLQDRPLLRPGEVLETVPGLVVTQHSGDGKANQYFLRGYNLDHGTDFATSVDGVPVNMVSNAHGQGYTDLNFLIPEFVDRIDYRKGTYFAENGDFSSAGSADIQYRNTLGHNLFELTEGDSGYQRAVMGGSIVLGSQADKGTLNSSGPTLFGGLELMEENGPWTVPEGLRKVNALARLSDGTRANGWSIDAIDYQAHWNSTDQVPLALIESGQLGRFSALDPSDGGDTGRAILSGEWHQHDTDGYAKVAAYVEHYRLQLWSDFSFFELRPATGDQFSQLESRDMLGIKAVKGWNHELFGQDSVTEVGLQVRHDHIHVGLQDTEDRVNFDTVSDNIVGETEAGIYAQNSTGWTSWLRSVIGVRADQLNMDVTSLNIPQNSGNASASKVSPKMALIFGPWDKTEFFVDSGEGFHTNDARGVIDTVDPTTGAPALKVPAIAGSWGNEIGMRTEAIPGLQSSLALWSLNSASELIYNADADVGSTTANGASKRYGIEWNNHMAIRSWLLLDADFAWTHARFYVDNDNGALGDYIPNAVPKVGTIALTVNNLGPWSGEVNTRYIGGYPLSQDGTLMGPSAVITNLRIQRQILPNLKLSLNALNIFNRQYYDIAYEQDYQVTRTSPLVPTGVTVHPGEPREFRLTLNMTF